MATNYPGSKHSFSGTIGEAAEKMNAPNHVTHHTNEDDTSEAIQDKLGTGASTPTSKKLLRGTGSGTSAWDKDAPTGTIVGTSDTQTMTNKTLTSPNINSPDLNMANNAAITSRNAADGADLDLIAANASDKTIIGQNSVRPTIFVPVTNVSVVSATPGNTNWIPVDVTTQTSARAIAIIGSVRLRDTAGAQMGLFLRKTGSGLSQGILTNIINTVTQAGSAFGSMMVTLDSSQSFDWSVDSSNADNVDIAIWAYIENVD